MRITTTVLAVALIAAPAAADNALTEQEKKDGWLLLFDGRTLDGWMTSSRQPSRRPVEDGCLNPHRCGGYMLVHQKQWDDFVLTLDFKISKGCNSGVFVRTASLTPRPAFGDVAWARPSQLRNRIVHGYWSIDLAVLHTTAVDDLPGFVSALRGVLTNLEAE